MPFILDGLHGGDGLLPLRLLPRVKYTSIPDTG